MRTRLLLLCTLAVLHLAGCVSQQVRFGEPAADGVTVKRVIDAGDDGGSNLLRPDGWRPFLEGYTRSGADFVCDNGDTPSVHRGVSQTVELNQTSPEPIIAAAWSKAEDVGGGPNNDYSLYLDLIYTDGTPLWGQIASFSTGDHDWERREVVVFPQRPIKTIHFYMLFREHTGKASFRDPALRVIKRPEGVTVFDGVPVSLDVLPGEGFQVRDVGSGSDFVGMENEALGLQLDSRRTEVAGATFIDATVTDLSHSDRAITLVYSVPIEGEGWSWLEDPRRSRAVASGYEHVCSTRINAGANQRLSRYPFGAVANARRGMALGIDMSYPAVFRVGCNADTHELFIAYDIGLTPEKPSAHVRLCHFAFDPEWEFRGALARFYELFPEQFRCRAPRQGTWIPFARISEVEGWEDFGFRFKNGINETQWDDEHDILSFRYVWPMTWLMTMPSGMPRTYDAALAEARRLADEDAIERARALFTSGYHDEEGRLTVYFMDMPWCTGATWSVNSAPGVLGNINDFRTKWSGGIRNYHYGPDRVDDQDGEYIDLTEGQGADELNFRRDHFAVADTPLTFCAHSRRPGIFVGLGAFEFARGIARDIHDMDKLMMANAVPDRFCWLAPLLDIMGVEVDWNRNRKWEPMSDADLLYRRVMSKGKPYCFLMNTIYERFSYELAEKYMKRCLAYGMFPSFFSHNAQDAQYFTRPALYNRDRSLFKKYVPLCKLVAEAGWEPITLARSSDERVYVERFGERHLTVFNDSPDRKTVIVTLDGLSAASARDLVRDQPVPVRDGVITLTLEGEDVAVLELP